MPDTCQAGIIPNRNTVSAASSPVKPKTRQFSTAVAVALAVSRRGMFFGAMETSRPRVHAPSTSPRAQPSTASMALSTSNSHMIASGPRPWPAGWLAAGSREARQQQISDVGAGDQQPAGSTPITS